MDRRKIFSGIVLTGLVFVLSGCFPSEGDSSSPCRDRSAVFCEDFEDEDNYQVESSSIGANATDLWWVTDDQDSAYFYADFPVAERSRKFMIILGNGDYNNETIALLYTPQIDLTKAESASLAFNLIYRSERHWDGLVVYAGSTEPNSNDETTWVMLSPPDGYPDTILLDHHLTPGYSGNSQHWIHEDIDLFPVLGKIIQIAFIFTSDFVNTDWGIGLDDIVVRAEPASSVSVNEQIPALSDIKLTYPADPLITAEIPRAYALVDTACEGEITDTFKKGQRAYVKAENESRDRILVLHPDKGNFCWVSNQDVWIDGNEKTLSRLSDLKPEDRFLPFCPLTATLLQVDPACPASVDPGEGKSEFLPYQISYALVERGKITAILLDPAKIPPDSDIPEISEIRTGNRKNLPNFNLTGRQPGKFELLVQENTPSCLVDQVHPGRVICEGLALDPAGPLQMELCWSGWDALQICPPGFTANSAQTGCLPLETLGECSLGCPAGYQADQGAGICRLNQAPEILEVTDELCPPGIVVQPDARCCFDPDYTLVTVNTPQICTTLEVLFPAYDVTVKQSTRCLNGPDNNAEIVSSLKPFTIVEILGIGEDNQHLVVNNPAYQVPCWAPVKDFYLDQLDLSILPVFRTE